jgi:hypothetical protein
MEDERDLDELLVDAVAVAVAPVVVELLAVIAR